MNNPHHAALTLIPQDMRHALAKLDSDAEQIVASFLTTLESRQPPSTIYHYTNDVGLRGILETGKLWLTHFQSQ